MAPAAPAQPPRPAAPALDTRSFRDALGRFATGVAFVTAAPDGQPAGLIVNSLTSVSLDPPLVSFCPSRSSLTWQRMRRTGRFAVNVLGRQHERFAIRATPAGADRFAGLDWQPGPHGTPLLTDALATLECQIVGQHAAGDHWIVVARVDEVRIAPGGETRSSSSPAHSAPCNGASKTNGAPARRPLLYIEREPLRSAAPTVARTRSGALPTCQQSATSPCSSLLIRAGMIGGKMPRHVVNGGGGFEPMNPICASFPDSIGLADYNGGTETADCIRTGAGVAPQLACPHAQAPARCAFDRARGEPGEWNPGDEGGRRRALTFVYATAAVSRPRA